MSTELLSPGLHVEVSDPLGYSGTGTVVRWQTTPTDAVLVKMLTITDRTDQSVVGREVWVMRPHVTVMPSDTYLPRHRRSS